jgi:hypothetical protein
MQQIQKRFFENFRRSLREDAVVYNRIWECERTYARSHSQIRLPFTAKSGEPQKIVFILEYRESPIYNISARAGFTSAMTN